MSRIRNPPTVQTTGEGGRILSVSGQAEIAPKTNAQNQRVRKLHEDNSFRPEKRQTIFGRTDLPKKVASRSSDQKVIS